MALESPLGTDPKRPWFVGEDKYIDFEIFADDGREEDDPQKTMDDASTWPLVFSLKKDDTKTDALFEKRSAPAANPGITIVGAYAPLRTNNTQRVRVAVKGEDTDTLKGDTYRYSLKRLLTGGDAILAYGDALIQKSTAPPS